MFIAEETVSPSRREEEHEVISVDIDKRDNPELCEEVLQLKGCITHIRHKRVCVETLALYIYTLNSMLGLLEIFGPAARV